MKANKTTGWYFFADGFQTWVFGMNATEKKRYIREHGAIVGFHHTN